MPASTDSGLARHSQADTLSEKARRCLATQIEEPGDAHDPQAKESPDPSFRAYMPDLSQPRFQTAKHQTAYEYAAHFRETRDPPWLFSLTQTWEQLLSEDFKGITTDGNVTPDVHERMPNLIDQKPAADATQNVLKLCTPQQKSQVRFPINARQWRAWSNPEFLLRPFGIRLDELTIELSTAVLAVLKASFSSKGFDKAIAAMRINDFLGELCDIQKVMNRLSYNFLIFGEPNAGTNAWGWSLYGHHLCLNCFFKSGQIVVSPFFTGAEPNVIDSGPWVGTSILRIEEKLGLKLMQSLTHDQRKIATTFESLKDPDMTITGNLKADRWNRDDQRHLCGAFRDNRVVPYEGMKAALMTSEQQATMCDIADQFLLYLPDHARAQYLRSFARYIEETFFCWIGGHADDDPFYYRIQNPVFIFEFDHHSGVFLSNSEPAKFHIHTLMRMPNAGDYGQALRDESEKLL